MFILGALSDDEIKNRGCRAKKMVKNNIWTFLVASVGRSVGAGRSVPVDRATKIRP